MWSTYQLWFRSALLDPMFFWTIGTVCYLNVWCMLTDVTPPISTHLFLLTAARFPATCLTYRKSLCKKLGFPPFGLQLFLPLYCAADRSFSYSFFVFHPLYSYDLLLNNSFVIVTARLEYKASTLFRCCVIRNIFFITQCLWPMNNRCVLQTHCCWQCIKFLSWFRICLLYTSRCV